jgi:hypothetical protein
VDLYSEKQVTNFLAIAAFPLFMGKHEQGHETINGAETATHFLKF